MNTLLRLFILIALLALFLTGDYFIRAQQSSTHAHVIKSVAPTRIPSTTQQEVLVTRVIDGDTIEIEGGEKVRYIGIDTPETKHPQKTVQCFGKEASEKNKELVEGRKVRLEKDVSQTDRYGRLLRYIYLDDVFVNDYLVRQGFAHASTYPPDVKYQDQFLEAQKEARDNNRGLWTTCKTK